MDAKDHISQSKGKEKAETSTPDQTSTDSKTTNNIGNRIVESARGLLQSSLAPGADAAQTLSSSSAFGDKTRISGSAGAASSAAQDLGSSQRAGVGSSGEVQSSSYGLRDSFRTQDGDSGMDREFEDFLASRLGPELDDISRTREMETSWNNLTKTADVEALESVQIRERIEYDDGAEVRALLADPSFNAYAEEELSAFDQEAEQSIDDLFPQNFSPEEQSAVSKFRASLPQPPFHRPIDPNHPLSLRPRSDKENRAIEENIDNILNGSFDAQQTSTTPEMQDEEWLNSWIGVLNGYTDEVWGDMLPVVRETRMQLEEVKKGELQIDNKAVARLKMILGHLETNR
jgi:hypothetical protein